MNIWLQQTHSRVPTQAVVRNNLQIILSQNVFVFSEMLLRFLQVITLTPQWSKLPLKTAVTTTPRAVSDHFGYRDKDIHENESSK